jgi:hypothetical protein
MNKYHDVAYTAAIHGYCHYPFSFQALIETMLFSCMATVSPTFGTLSAARTLAASTHKVLGPDKQRSMHAGTFRSVLGRIGYSRGIF